MPVDVDATGLANHHPDVEATVGTGPALFEASGGVKHTNASTPWVSVLISFRIPLSARFRAAFLKDPALNFSRSILTTSPSALIWITATSSSPSPAILEIEDETGTEM